MPPQPIEVKEPVDGTQQVIDGDVIVQSELIEKALLHYQRIAHHRCSLRFTAQPVNQRQSPVATPTFSNDIGQQRTLEDAACWFDVVGSSTHQVAK
jgi:hypothetical protein